MAKVEASARGRPLSAATHSAILTATAELLSEHAYESVSFDRIAARARVGKAAIFRRWDSKAALVSESLTRLFDAANPALPDHPDPRERTRRFLLNTAEMLTTTAAGAAIRNLISQIPHEPELAASVAAIEAERRQLIFKLLEPFGPDAETRGLLMSLMFGPIYLRWLVTREPTDQAFVNALVERVLGDIDVR